MGRRRPGRSWSCLTITTIRVSPRDVQTELRLAGDAGRDRGRPHGDLLRCARRDNVRVVVRGINRRQNITEDDGGAMRKPTRLPPDSRVGQA
jgi:hypothetical protein